MTRAGPHKDTWTRPGERWRHPVLILTKSQTKDGRTPPSEAWSYPILLSKVKNLCSYWKLDPFVTLFLAPLIMSPLLAIVTCCHQVCVPPCSVCTASCANIGPAPRRVCSERYDTAGWRLNLGNIKIRELMQIANSFKRFSSHSKDQGVEPGWFAFQWALSKLIWYHLDLWPNETNDRTSWKNEHITWSSQEPKIDQNN